MSEQSTESAPQVSEAVQTSLKESNEDRKRAKLRKSITRAHEWRVQVWAQSELKIQGAQAQLDVLNGGTVELFEPQFDDPDMVAHYASMQLTK